MSADLERLLHDTAVEPERHPDPADLVARGRRRRRTRRAAAGAGAALAVLAVAVLVPAVLPDDRPVIVDEPSPGPRPSPTATSPQADVRQVAAEVAERAGGAAAVADGFGSVWFAGPSRDDERRENADVVRASSDGSRLEAVVTVPVPMSHLAVTGDAVWAVRAGDGAVPQNVMVRVDPDTNEVVGETDLGAFSTAGMVTTDTGDLLLVSGNTGPAEAMWVSGDTGDVVARTGIDVLESAVSVAYRDGTVVVADFASSSVMVVDEQDLRTGVLPEPVRVPYPPTHVTFDADGGLWVASVPESTVTLVDAGADPVVGESFFLPRPPVAAFATADGGAVVVTFDGTVVRESVDGEPTVVSEGPFDTTVAARAADRVWLVSDQTAGNIASVGLGPAPAGDAVPLDRDDRPNATAAYSDTPALVDSQGTAPQELADEFADIATTAADARTVWQRFNLTGQPPQVDFDTTALLFVGFGESGSCPARFDGMSVDGDRVHLVIGTEGDGSTCTDDYNPRTMVLGVARDALPDGGFELTISGRTFVLSSVPLSEPPRYDDAVVGRLTSESPQLDFDARPPSAPSGRRIELALTNEGDVAASTGSWPMVLYRWDDQRWLPADGNQGRGEPHGSIEEVTATVQAGDQQVIAYVDSEALEPGWYGVYAKLQLGGRGGAVEVYESFEVSAQ